MVDSYVAVLNAPLEKINGQKLRIDIYLRADAHAADPNIGTL